MCERLTEDDTFRILSRATYQEVSRAIREICYSADFFDQNRLAVNEIKKMGWTVEEYNRAFFDHYDY